MPRRPTRWAPVLAFGVIVVGIGAALFVALLPVHSSDQRHGEGCGDAAAAVVLNGEGAHVIGAGTHRNRPAASPCYQQAEERLLLSAVLLFASFAAVLVALYISRREPAGRSLRSR